MAIFLLDCDGVMSVSSKIESLSSKMTEVSSNMESYDTTCEDEFDFSSAVDILSRNVSACSEKIKKTSLALETVVSSHTQLQSSFKFGEDNNSSESNNTDDSQSISKKSSSSGSYASTSTSSYASASSSSYVSASSLISEEEESENAIKEEQTISDVKLPSVENPVTVENELKKVDYVCLNENGLSEDSKEIINDENFNYNNEGYATINDYYFIACDKSVGAVGDVINFNKKDGSITKCIVVTNTVTENNVNKINFIVENNKWNENGCQKNFEELLNNSIKIENVGNYKLIKNTVVNNANDDITNNVLTTDSQPITSKEV